MPRLALALGHQRLDKKLARIPKAISIINLASKSLTSNKKELSLVFLKAQGHLHEQAAACASLQALLQDPRLLLQQAADRHCLEKAGC